MKYRKHIEFPFITLICAGIMIVYGVLIKFAGVLSSEWPWPWYDYILAAGMLILGFPCQIMPIIDLKKFFSNLDLKGDNPGTYAGVTWGAFIVICYLLFIK